MMKKKSASRDEELAEASSRSRAANGETISVELRYAHGGPRCIGRMLDGEMHGAWEFFRSDGSLMRRGRFERGRQVGEWTTYGRDGKPVKTTEFR